MFFSLIHESWILLEVFCYGVQVVLRFTSWAQRYKETIYLIQLIKFINNCWQFSPNRKRAWITLLCSLARRLLFHCISTSSGLFYHHRRKSAAVVARAAGVPRLCRTAVLSPGCTPAWGEVGKHGRNVEQDSLRRGRLLWKCRNEWQVPLMACLGLQWNCAYPEQVETRCSLLSKHLLAAPCLLHCQVLIQLQTSGKKLNFCLLQGDSR